jgi:hypothetical protein
VARAIAEGANCAIAVTHHLVVTEHGLDPPPRPPRGPLRARRARPGGGPL